MEAVNRGLNSLLSGEGEGEVNTLGLYKRVNHGRIKLKKTQTDAAISTTVSFFSTQAHLPTYLSVRPSVSPSVCLSLPSSVY